MTADHSVSVREVIDRLIPYFVDGLGRSAVR